MSIGAGTVAVDFAFATVVVAATGAAAAADADAVSAPASGNIFSFANVWKKFVGKWEMGNGKNATLLPFRFIEDYRRHLDVEIILMDHFSSLQFSTFTLDTR